MTKRMLLALSLALFVAGSLAACGGEPLDAWNCDCFPAAPGGTDHGGAPDVGASDAGPRPDVDRCALGEPIPIDILWIVDNSTSMCQEQLALADGFASFLTTLQAAANVDIRTAVTTTNVLSADWQGRFNSSPDVAMPPLCYERRVFPAEADLHCECAACAGWDLSFQVQRCNDARGSCPDGGGSTAYDACLLAGGCAFDPAAKQWVLEAGDGNVYNQNGSVNTGCVLRCAGDDDGGDPEARNEICQRQLRDDRFVCEVPGGDVRSSGCVIPPALGACPPDLQPVLPAVTESGAIRYGLETFRCIAAVGIEQTTDANLEQGMEAAWRALAADGPYPTQVCAADDPVLADASLSEAEKRAQCRRAFLREDAFLVLVFLTDEDDCSLEAGAELAPEDYQYCSLLGDADTESRVPDGMKRPSTAARPLAAVSAYAVRFASLRPEGQVFVAAISGDVWEEGNTMSPEERDAARERYVQSLLDLGNTQARQTSVCASPFGTAGLGHRYIRLAETFDTHGFFGNICATGGLEPSLQDIAVSIGAVLPCQ